MARALTVVIIDDVSTYRKILNLVIEDFVGIECIGEFSDGISGLKGIEQLQPDLVLLDIEMPGMNGIEVLQQVAKRFPQIGVIMISGFDKKQADITVKALELGAIDFIPKPSEGNFEENIAYLKKKIAPLIHVFSTKKNLEMIRQLTGKISSDVKKKEDYSGIVSKAKPVGKIPEKVSEKNADKAIEAVREKIPEKVLEKVPERPRKESLAGSPFKIDMVAIGVSTGGPYALAEVIPKLPADFPVPVVIVQHMPPTFTASLSNSLSKKSNIPVIEAKSRDIVEPGKVLLAPGGFHMVLKKDGQAKDRMIVTLEETPTVHGCRPSVDVMFKSIAQNFSGNVLAVVMTGMGADGTDGVRALKTRKCYCIVQDEESCVVFGMPKVVIQNNLADEVIPLKDLARRITEIVKNSK